MSNPKTTKEISEIQDPDEKQVAFFLKNLGFSSIIFDPIINDSNFQIGEIDSIFQFEDYLLLVEVSAKDKQSNLKKNYFFSKWEDAYNLGKMSQQYEVDLPETDRIFRIYFDMAKDDPENHAGIDHITKRRKNNKVVYFEKFKEFSDELEKNPTLARTKFLEWLNHS